jgi:membrane protease subunit HflK
MAWNEPDNNDRNDSQNNDPWGSRGRKNQGPPDLDRMVADFLKKLSRLGKNRSSNNGSNGGANISSGILSLIILGALLVWAGSGFYTLDEQERGVVFRLGKAQEAVVAPGLHWNPPLIDEVIPVNVTRVYDRSFSNTMLTEDDNIVDITMTVQYVITDARKFILEVEDPEVSLQEAAESAIRHVVGGSRMDDVISTGREILAQEAHQRLQTYIDNYGTGILISQVNIAQSLPPQQVRAAFDDVIKAREDNQSYQNEARRYANQIVPEARGQARRALEEANAYKEQVIANAQGEASRFEQVLVEYNKAPEVTRERMYIDTLQHVMSSSSKVMVDVEGGNNMMYLPLDQIMQQTRRTPNVTGSEVNGNSGSLDSNSLRQQPQRGGNR